MWVNIELAAVKEDRDAEAVAVSEASSALLDPLDLGVDALGEGVGDGVLDPSSTVVIQKSRNKGKLRARRGRVAPGWVLIGAWQGRRRSS